MIIKLKNQYKQSREEVKKVTQELNDLKKNLKITRFKEITEENKALYKEIESLSKINEKSNAEKQEFREMYLKYKNLVEKNSLANSLNTDQFNRTKKVNSSRVNQAKEFKIDSSDQYKDKGTNKNKYNQLQSESIKLKGDKKKQMMDVFENISKKINFNSSTQVKGDIPDSIKSYKEIIR